MSNKLIKNKNIKLQSNLYEFNKVQMSQIEPLDKEWLKRKCKEVANELYNSSSKYYLLLCRERYDFTMFNIINKEGSLGDDLFETITNRGEITDFTKQENGSYEIWVRDFETKENFAYYLFDYSFGVVEV